MFKLNSYEFSTTNNVFENLKTVLEKLLPFDSIQIQLFFSKSISKNKIL